VNALADGMCLAIEKAAVGQDYIFAGEPVALHKLFQKFNRTHGGFKVRLRLPRWFMRPQVALLEPLQRWLGLPAFMSREAEVLGKLGRSACGISAISYQFESNCSACWGCCFCGWRVSWCALRPLLPMPM